MSNDEDKSGKAFLEKIKKDRRFKDATISSKVEEDPFSWKAQGRRFDAVTERAKKERGN